MSTGDIKITPIEEGDGLDADSLNSPFDSMESGVNGLDQESIAPGALSWPHLSRNKGNTSYIITAGSAHRTSVLPDSPGDTITWLPAGGGHYVTNAIFRRSHVTDAPVLDRATLATSVEILDKKGQDYAGGILLLADIDIRKILDFYPLDAPPGGVERPDNQAVIWLAAYVSVNGGVFSWVSLPVTERFIDSADGALAPPGGPSSGTLGGTLDHSEVGVIVSIRHLLTPNSIPWERGAGPSGYQSSGTTTATPVTSIRVSDIAIRASLTSSHFADEAPDRIHFGNSRLTCLAFRGTLLSAINTSDTWVGYDGSDIGTV